MARTAVTVDPRAFEAVSSIDTCAVCNLLSSKRLLSAAVARRASFLVAGYVRYELLVRRRTAPTHGDLEIQQKVATALRTASILSEHAVSIADLQVLAAHPEAGRMGRGETAALALALRARKAFTTDDQSARRAAGALGIVGVQTTPQMLGWLFYLGELTDCDLSTVVGQHEERVGPGRGRLTRFFRIMYEHACMLRLADRPATPINVPTGPEDELART